MTFLQSPFFILLQKTIRFSDIMQFSDEFCGDLKCHQIEIALYSYSKMSCFHCASFSYSDLFVHSKSSPDLVSLGPDEKYAVHFVRNKKKIRPFVMNQCGGINQLFSYHNALQLSTTFRTP